MSYLLLSYTVKPVFIHIFHQLYQGIGRQGTRVELFREFFTHTIFRSMGKCSWHMYEAPIE